MQPVIWHGRYFATLCPFHESHSGQPSFLVFDNGGVCLSASCHRRASLQQIYNKLAHINPSRSFVHRTDVVSWENMPDLETLVGQAHEYLLLMPEQGWYLQQRGIEDRIEPQQLGWWLGWYTIPIFDERGHLSGLVLRAGPSVEQFHSVRYITPPNQPPMLYAPDWKLIRTAQEIYVVFGIIDALILTGLRLPAISPTNVTGLRPGMLERFRTRLIVCPDKGEEDKGRELVSGLDWRGELRLLSYPKNVKDIGGLAHHPNTLLRLLQG